MSWQGVIIDTFDDPVTLDPHRAIETGSQHAVMNVYDGLLGFDEARQLTPVLAAALPQVVDGDDEYLVHIPVRPGVRFHDGSLMGVEDVVYSLRRVVITADVPAALWCDALLGQPVPKLTLDAANEMVSRITPAGEGVLLRLRRPYRPLNALMVQWSPVVSRQWCALHGDWDGEPVSIAHFLLPDQTALDSRCNGTGLYRLVDWDRQTRELRYQKTLREFAGPERGPETVVLRAVDDSAQREHDLTVGRSDFSVCLTESRVRLGQTPGIVVEQVVEARSVNPLGFITQRLDPGCQAIGTGRFGPEGLPPDAFTDVHMRRMIALCFDHRQYERDTLHGEAAPHAMPFPATLVPGLAAGWPVTDLARARDEFAAAWGGQPARDGCRIVIYAHDTNVSRVQAAVLLAKGLAQVSDKIVAEIEYVDIATLVSMLYRSQCPIAWTGWVSDFLHPYALVSCLLDQRAPLPAALGFTDPMLQDLVDRARTYEPDSEPGPYQEITEYVTENALFLGPANKIDFMMYRDRWRPVGLKNHIPHVLDFSSFVASGRA